MNELFFKILNMSISASWLVLVVLILRLVLKKAPKWVNVLLWGIVAVRLICPLTIESRVSLIPDSVGSGELVAEWMDDYIGDIDIHHPDSIYYDAAIGAGREPISDGEGGYYVVTKHDQLGEPATIENTVMPVLSVVWASGMILLALYTAISYWRLRCKIDTAVLYTDNIFQSENVSSPFVFGIIKPRIYLPFKLDGQDLEHVVAHEQAHIRRKDHWWKPLGFLLLTIHWFNPLMWLAFVLLCRDIELACDEKVIKELGNEQRADYTQALVACSVNRRMIAACPLAFGEVGVKERVKSVMNYKKPAFWIVVVAIISCVATAVCFLTNPADKEPDLSFLNYENAISLVADVDEVMAIYCPSSDDGSGGSIQVGAATGTDLAKQLDRWDWKECSAPRQTLPSPGSVEFIIEEDYRITVHQRKSGSLRQYAVVKHQDEVRYYRIDRSDYPDAVSLVHTPGTQSDTFQATALESRDLTQDEIDQVNEAFAPIIFDKQGNPIGTNIWSCFFTSYYSDVRDMNFAEFLAYFPGDGSTVDEEEFAVLKELKDFLFYGEVSALADMPVPVHRYPARIIDLVLNEYAGITVDDLDTSDVNYLSEYDAFYNYTSDAGHGTFTCTRGEVDGDIVRLYEELDDGTDMLTLRKEGDVYHIIAHQRLKNG